MRTGGEATCDGGRVVAARGLGLGVLVALASMAVGCRGSSEPLEPAEPGSCALDPGMSTNEIKVGAVFPTSGQNGDFFKVAGLGMAARFHAENVKGGVGGRQLTLVSEDDGDGELANLNAARHLVVEEKVFGLIEVSTNTDGGGKFLAEEGVPVTGWGITSAWGTYDNMFGYRHSTSPKPEGEAVTRSAQFIKDHGGERVAIVAGGANASINVANQFAETLPVLGMTVGYKTTEVALGDNDFSVHLQRMIDAEVDSLYTGMGATQNADLYKAATQAGLHFKVAVFPSGYDERFAAAFGADLEGVYVAIDWRPYELPVPAHDVFKENLAAVAPDEFPSQLAMVGWLSADAFIRGLLEAGPTCPTREAFIANLRLVEDYDADGLLPPTDFGAMFGKMPLCFYYLQLHDSHFVPVDDEPFCGVLLKDYEG